MSQIYDDGYYNPRSSSNNMSGGNYRRENSYPNSNNGSYQNMSTNQARRPANDRNAEVSSDRNQAPPKVAQKKFPQQPKAPRKPSGKLASTLNQTRCEILTEQLRKNKCECMVCCQNIKSDKAVWSCNVCFHIFHLHCIKKWASSPSAKIEGKFEID